VQIRIHESCWLAIYRRWLLVSQLASKRAHKHPSRAHLYDPEFNLRIADDPPGMCRARTRSPFVFLTEYPAYEGGRRRVLFCNRCAVRRFTFLMKRGTLQSLTAPYFDCGSFRFAETGQTELDLHPRA
jgi:hypothetical protein